MAEEETKTDREKHDETFKRARKIVRAYFERLAREYKDAEKTDANDPVQEALKAGKKKD